MIHLYRINFLLWLLAFLLSFWIDELYLDIVFGICTLVFVLELIHSYRLSKNFKEFLKNNYIDILLLIPIFKVLKFSKIAKALRFKKLFRGLDALGDLLELVFRIKR